MTLQVGTAKFDIPFFRPHERLFFLISLLHRLFRELKRRKVFRVAGVYGVVAWVSVEVADTTAPLLALPGWVPTFVLFLALVGFPLALVLAWAFDVTPDGVKRTEHTEKPAPGRTPAPGWGRLAGIFATGTLVASFGAYMYSGAAGADGPEDGDLIRSVAVLPFANLSAEEENAFFAAGIHEEVLTQLSRIADLKVISRTSVLPYAGAGKSMREIGRELDVRTVVEGSVQRYGDQIRVTVQLIDAETDEHLWAERYDRSLDDIFQIQTEIALAITDALRARLTPEEQRRIETRPTENTEAYTYYLQALEHWRGPHAFEEETIRTAERLFARAIEVDPDFALAHARLSMLHSWIHWMRYDRTPERLERARGAAERALDIQPALSEAHLALGTYHYWGFRDYGRALQELRIAGEGLPNSAEVLEMTGYVQRRQGRWDRAIESLERAMELDPRNAILITSLGQAYDATYQFREALRLQNRMVEFAPANLLYRVDREMARFRATGDVSGLHHLADTLPAAAADQSFASETLLWGLFKTGAPEHVLRLIRSEHEQFGDTPASFLLGLAYGRLGEPRRATRNLESARSFYEERLRENSEDWKAHSVLGPIHAHLGNREQALIHARRAVEILPPSRDAWEGPGTVFDLGWTHAVLGDTREAVQQLERIVNRPSGPTVHQLRMDPRWEPIRDHPGFQRLLGRAVEMDVRTAPAS